MNRRELISALALAALCPATARAQNFPTKPIKLIVPFAAGGAADLFARVLAKEMSGDLGEQVFVEIHAGASGLTGVDVTAKSPPDGYTICLAGAAALSAIPFMVAKMPFSWEKDLALLTTVVLVPEVVVVSPRLGVNTLQEFVAYARANPGKINFGSAGTGSITHLASELLKDEAKIDIVHIPYRGVAPAVSDMLGDHIQMITADVPFLLPHITLRRGQGAGGDVRKAQCSASGCADDGGGRLSAREFRQLVRACRTGRHAGLRSRQDFRYVAARRAGERRHQKSVRIPECRCRAVLAGGIRRLHQGGAGQMGAGRRQDRREARLRFRRPFGIHGFELTEAPDAAGRKSRRGAHPHHEPA